MWTSIHSLFTAIIDVIVIVKKYKFKIYDMKNNIPVWAMVIFTVAMFMVLFWFGLYHAYLICRNRTTNEEMRGKYRKYKGNPWDKGCGSNCSSYFKRKSSRVLDSSTTKIGDLENEFSIQEREAQRMDIDLIDEDID